MKRFSGKVAVVTGAAQGIGLATALRLRAEGAKVILADLKNWDESIAKRNLDGADDFAYVETDVTKKAAVDAMIETAVARFGGVDVMVSNAGIARKKAFLELSEEEFKAGLQVNLVSAFLCSQAAVRQMVKQGRGGVLINMSSVNAIMTMPGFTTYNVSKGGIEQLTRVLATELAPLGIRANAVGPGTIVTELTQQAVLTDEESSRMIMSRTPLGRFGQPDDVASAIAFLASDDAGYITGETIYIDGGRKALNYVVSVTN